jgi:Trk-type K+ transport system membrane component
MRSRVLEIIGGVAIALVVVGMVSSYLLVNFLMVVLPGFGDSIYREASKGPYDMHSLIRMTIFALMMVVVVYFILWAAHYFLTRMSFLKRMSFNEALYGAFQVTGHHVVFNLLAVALLLCSLVLNMWVTAIHAVTQYSLSSIEALSPEIPENTRLRLKVDFYCMRNADDFHYFQRKLQVLSKARNVTLPDFDLL